MIKSPRASSFIWREESRQLVRLAQGQKTRRLAAATAKKLSRRLIMHRCEIQSAHLYEGTCRRPKMRTGNAPCSIRARQWHKAPGHGNDEVHSISKHHEKLFAVNPKIIPTWYVSSGEE